MRFDTRDKKPKEYSIAILTLMTAVIVAVLSLSGAASHGAAISAVIAAYLLAVIVLLIFAFFRQIQYNPYSYNTIYYIGFALLALSAFITQIIITVRLAAHPELEAGYQITSTLLGSAMNHMLWSFPFILMFSLALFASNISLLRHEGKRLVNVLGIILAVLMLAGEIFFFSFEYYVSGSVQEVRLHELFGNFFAACYLYFECMLLGAMVANAIAARYEPEPDKDFLIVLGCGLRKDGTPTPLLRGRLDRALTFYQKQKAATGKELTFITSGGQGADEATSESAAMKRYLLEHGIPEQQIVEEDRSTNTFENMKFSREKIMALNAEGRIAFATTNYHVFRSGLYARRLKMRAVGMGASTKWYFWPNASVREFIGILTEHRGKQALIFGGMAVFYIVMTLLVYR
ncbi:MAG: YdcF family protein [Firmicutes bacterium]|nr:YdcF family protein [Bacillota bacterium]